MLYHVKVHDSSVPRGADGNTCSSLVAVSTGAHEDRLIVKVLQGPGLHVRLLQSVLEQSVFTGSNFLLQCLAAHKARTYPYGVELRSGTHGAESFILRYAKQPELMDMPNGSRVHVSMYAKLNEGIDVWYGDVPPLLAALYQRHSQASVSEPGAVVERVDLRDPVDPLGHQVEYRSATLDSGESLVRAMAPHLLPPPVEAEAATAAVTPDSYALNSREEAAPTLTIDALRAIGACGDGMQEFLTVFPDGVAPLTVESLRRWREHGFRLSTISNFLDVSYAQISSADEGALRTILAGLRDRQRSYGERSALDTRLVVGYC